MRRRAEARRSNRVERASGSRSESAACDNRGHVDHGPLPPSARLHLRSRRHARRQHAPPRGGLPALHRPARPAAPDRARCAPAWTASATATSSRSCSARRSLRRCCGRYADEKETLYRELSHGRLVALPGLTRLLDALERRGLPAALATSAPLENVAHTLAELGLTSRLTQIVRSDTMARGKPHPDVFLAAAQLIEVAARGLPRLRGRARRHPGRARRRDDLRRRSRPRSPAAPSPPTAPRPMSRSPTSTRSWPGRGRGSWTTAGDDRRALATRLSG